MVLFLSFSNIISRVLDIIAGLLIARWIAPEVLGFFSTFTLIAGYLVYIQVGVPMAFAREYPLNIGKNNVRTAFNYAAVAQSWAIILTAIIFVVAFITGGYHFLHNEYKDAFGYLVIAVLSFETYYITQYLKLLYRNNRDFNKLSIINLVRSVVAFMGIVFVYYYGFYGLGFRVILAIGVQSIIAFYWRPTKIKPKFNKGIFYALLKIGIPMFVVANFITVWPLLQRTLTLELGGIKSLGLFVIPAMIFTAMGALSGAISSVLYPTMTIAWGKGNTIGELFKKSYKPLIINTSILVITIPFAWVLLPSIIHKVLPKYVDATLAAQWMLITGLISSFNVWIDIYNVVNRQISKLISIISGILVWATAFSVLYYSSGFHLEIIPQSLIFGYLVMISFHLIFILKNYNKSALNFSN